MKRQAYPDDITDKEWELIEPILLRDKSRGGRNPKYARREVMNAIFYLVRSGCSWRHLPHDFPPWNIVYTQFVRWRNRGILEKIHDTVKERVRVVVGRNPTASGGIIDSQSVKTNVGKGASGFKKCGQSHFSRFAFAGHLLCKGAFFSKFNRAFS